MEQQVEKYENIVLYNNSGAFDMLYEKTSMHLRSKGIHCAHNIHILKQEKVSGHYRQQKNITLASGNRSGGENIRANSVDSYWYKDIDTTTNGLEVIMLKPERIHTRRFRQVQGSLLIKKSFLVRNGLVTYLSQN